MASAARPSTSDSISTPTSQTPASYLSPRSASTNHYAPGQYPTIWTHQRSLMQQPTSQPMQQPTPRPGPPMRQPTSQPGPPPTGPSLQQPAVAAVAIKLPQFWAEDPHIWFAQVEAQFLLGRVTSETTKYGHAVAALPPKVVMDVRDILVAPPTARPYSHLKAAILERIAMSSRKRVQELLKTEALGDRTPSQLLRHMQKLQSDSVTTDDAIIRELFLSRLPPNVQAILAGTTTDVGLTQLAKMADQILEASPTVAHAAPAPVAMSSLQDTMEQLNNAVHAMSSANRRPSRRGSRTHSGDRNPPLCNQCRNHVDDSSRRSSRAASPRTGGYCYYHQRFKAAARKCQQPCSFPGNANASSQ